MSRDHEDKAKLFEGVVANPVMHSPLIQSEKTQRHPITVFTSTLNVMITRRLNRPTALSQQLRQRCWRGMEGPAQAIFYTMLSHKIEALELLLTVTRVCQVGNSIRNFTEIDHIISARFKSMNSCDMNELVTIT
jgi:hypothetical protein